MEDNKPFFRNYPIVKFPKGETIFLQDEIPRYIYSIKSGIVEASNSTHSGNRQCISFEVVGDIFPKSWAFSKTTKTLFDYKAFTNCELYVIDKSNFLLKLVDDIDFVNRMLSHTISSLEGARLQVDALEKPNAKLKLLYTFRYLCLLYGKEIDKDIVRIQLPLTQQEIADIVGLTRETTSKELSILKIERVISRERKYYSINTQVLRNFIDDDFNPGISVNLFY